MSKGEELETVGGKGHLEGDFMSGEQEEGRPGCKEVGTCSETSPGQRAIC